MLALEATPIGTWKDVIDNKYELSKDGILVHKRTRKVVKGFKEKGGYILDTFYIDGKKIAKRRHRLMWETFIGEIPEGMEVNHKDENPQNNRLSNLNLLTHKANTNWGTRNERVGKANRISLKNNKNRSKSVIQKTLQGKVVKIWESAKEVQKQLGYNCGHICNCCRGGRFDSRINKWHNVNTAYGYIWQYAED